MSSSGKVDLSEVERLEIENAILREALYQEKLEHAKTALKGASEGVKTASRDKELLFLRLMTQHGERLQGKKNIKLSPDAKSIVFEE